MAAIVYPATLPGPSAATVVAAERRLIAPRDDVRVTRPAQRDYLAFQDLTFEPLGSAQCAAWIAWWRDTLYCGGAWFAAEDWPLPSPWRSGVRRFAGVPQWRYAAGQGWRISARCEVRGAGIAPVDP